MSLLYFFLKFIHAQWEIAKGKNGLNIEPSAVGNIGPILNAKFRI